MTQHVFESTKAPGKGARAAERKLRRAAGDSNGGASGGNHLNEDVATVRLERQSCYNWKAGRAARGMLHWSPLRKDAREAPCQCSLLDGNWLLK